LEVNDENVIEREIQIKLLSHIRDPPLLTAKREGGREERWGEGREGGGREGERMRERDGERAGGREGGGRKREGEREKEKEREGESLFRTSGSKPSAQLLFLSSAVRSALTSGHMTH